MSILYEAYGNLEAYIQWLKNRGITYEHIINATNNERQMLLTAWSRINRNWKLTKCQLALIERITKLTPICPNCKSNASVKYSNYSWDYEFDIAMLRFSCSKCEEAFIVRGEDE